MAGRFLYRGNQKLNDGYHRVALCGIPTGNKNVYQIKTVDLSPAENLGFVSVTKLSQYMDKECK